MRQSAVRCLWPLKRLKNLRINIYQPLINFTKQKYTGTAQLIGTTQYSVNDLVNCVSPKFGINMLLRVKEVKHQVNNMGWITDLAFTSDQEAQA